MQENLSEASEKRPEGNRMTTFDEAAHRMREIAEPRPVGDSVKAAIDRVARAVSAFLPNREPMSYGRAEDIWRREARRIEAHEMDAIRAAHAARARSLRAEARAAGALADRLARLAAVAVDPATIADADALRRTADEARQAAFALRRLADAEAGLGAP